MKYNRTAQWLPYVLIGMSIYGNGIDAYGSAFSSLMQNNSTIPTIIIPTTIAAALAGGLYIRSLLNTIDTLKRNPKDTTPHYTPPPTKITTPEAFAQALCEFAAQLDASAIAATYITTEPKKKQKHGQKGPQKNIWQQNRAAEIEHVLKDFGKTMQKAISTITRLYAGLDSHGTKDRMNLAYRAIASLSYNSSSPCTPQIQQHLYQSIQRNPALQEAIWGLLFHDQPQTSTQEYSYRTGIQLNQSMPLDPPGLHFSSTIDLLFTKLATDFHIGQA